jgi:predicted HTH domain antitoxin
MKSVTIHLPENIDEREVRLAIAAVLYDRGILSSGQAADFAGITKREFVESLRKFGVSFFGETLNDLEPPAKFLRLAGEQ